jgi:putative endonuclease
MAGRDRNALGKHGEDLACAELRRLGYEILERRYRTRVGEIDIVAREGDVVVFVEVKARRGDGFGAGADAVTPWKQRRVARMAQDFVVRHRLYGRPCRFDVVAVDFAGERPRVAVYRHAFEADT